MHRRLEAVAKVDVQQLARVAVQHQVAGVPVAQAQQVAHHGHDARGPRVRRAPLQPHLRRGIAVLGLNVACGLLQYMYMSLKYSMA